MSSSTERQVRSKHYKKKAGCQHYTTTDWKRDSNAVAVILRQTFDNKAKSATLSSFVTGGGAGCATTVCFRLSVANMNVVWLLTCRVLLFNCFVGN